MLEGFHIILCMYCMYCGSFNTQFPLIFKLVINKADWESRKAFLKPFFGVKNWLNFFHLPFLYTFFCYFLFLRANPSHYFPLLSFCAHLYSFSGQYKLFVFIFFMHMLFFFQRTIQGIVSSLSLNKAKVGASSLPLLKFMHVTQILYFLLPTFLSFIFFFNSFPSSFFFFGFKNFNVFFQFFF